MKESRLGTHRIKPLMGCLPHFSSHVERRGLEDSSLPDLSYGCGGDQESYIVLDYHNDNDNNNNDDNKDDDDDEEVENHQALPLLVVSPPSKGVSPMLIRLLKNHHGSHSFPSGSGSGSGSEDAMRDHQSHHSFGRHKKGLRILTNIVGGTTGNGHCSDSANHVSPKGFVFVFVGKNEPMKRFLVPISLLNHPLLQDVLHEAQLEFGFHHQGPLRLPCHINEFERTLKTINTS